MIVRIWMGVLILEIFENKFTTHFKFIMVCRIEILCVLLSMLNAHVIAEYRWRYTKPTCPTWPVHKERHPTPAKHESNQFLSRWNSVKKIEISHFSEEKCGGGWNLKGRMSADEVGNTTKTDQVPSPFDLRVLKPSIGAIKPSQTPKCLTRQRRGARKWTWGASLTVVLHTLELT